ncbi:MAG: nucleoside hydrolase [Bacillota bacterium]|uniref:Nucleoside hydrolase n=2 Tax=Bacillati TaxID=1783272 RepID=A0A941DSJ0_9BACI|nr:MULTISPECIES: nucleoside hydrolase [Bacillaceae]NAZ07329.1 nucleoside hydrolase [Agaribacter marinus]MBR7794607.1 nucleoside hydrolase [Virgibacillus salarius]MCC2252173.1 nucleoside hydrolase [Virgibacillus sp. AGTR]MDY7045508.1 nucleoside hydrolase [Virgibacillus sp. M23]QRZ16349.1 nucleoside hydrolase [Virgibacillus sp. AGTR]
MRRVIIDTDTAGDDTIALLTALYHFKVEGVTITGGNVDFDQEVENALYTIQVFNPDYNVPVYKGHERPILSIGETVHRTVEDVHGKDGMGDSFFEKADQRPEDGHAVNFIIEKVKANPGEIEFLAIAPLTNIAMAIKKDPTIVKDIPHIYIMGGTNNALGNITAAAEYNFWVDPEAARIVLHAGIPITMVGWDMCTDYSVMNDTDHQEIAAIGTARSKFFMDINRVVMKFNKEVHKIDGTTHPDTLLVAIAANEELMIASNDYFVDIETKGELTRGYSLVDRNNRSEKSPNVRVCEGVDREKFRNTLIKVLSTNSY